MSTIAFRLSISLAWDSSNACDAASVVTLVGVGGTWASLPLSCKERTSNIIATVAKPVLLHDRIAELSLICVCDFFCILEEQQTGIYVVYNMI